MKKLLVALAIAGAVLVAVSLIRKNPTPTEEVTEQPVGKVDKVNIVSPTERPTVKIYSDTLKADRTLVLEGEVDQYSIGTLANQLLSLKDNGDKIYLLINSPGGSVIAGEQFISLMEGMKSPVYTVCTVLCASMAAHIHAHGKVRLAYNRATLMYHDASGGVQGEFNKMISLLSYFKLKIDKLDAYIARRAGMTQEEFQNYTKTDMWIDGEDATILGLNDGLFVPKFENLKSVTTVDEKMFIKKGIQWVK